MSRVFTSPSYLRATGGAFSQSWNPNTTGVTMLVWVKFTSEPSPFVPFLRWYNVGSSTSWNDYFGTVYSSTLTAYQARNYQGNNVTADGATTPTTDDGWHPVITRIDNGVSGDLTSLFALGDTPTDPTANGGNTTGVDNEFWIGADRNLNNPDFEGYIGHVAIWSNHLSDADIDLLLAGADPTTVDALNLKHYWAMTDSTLTDSVGSVTLINQGTTHGTSDNPPVGTGAILLAEEGSVAITGGEATLTYIGALSEGANAWFNGSWWRDPTFGTSWFGSTNNPTLLATQGSVVITGGTATLTSPADTITLLAEEGAIIISGGGAKLSVPLVATAASIVITGGDATLQIEYTSDEFVLSKSGTFDGKNITYGYDVAYNSSTDIGYTVLQRVDVDSLLLDGIFGTPPQPYKIQKYLTDTTVPAMITVEFNGTEWVVVSQTPLGL